MSSSSARKLKRLQQTLLFYYWRKGNQETNPHQGIRYLDSPSSEQFYSLICRFSKEIFSIYYILLLLLLLLTRLIVSNSVRPHGRQPTRLPRPWDSPGKNTGVGCQFLLQGMKVKSESESLSRVRLLATPRTAAYQAPPSMGFSRQEYWSEVPYINIQK